MTKAECDLHFPDDPHVAGDTMLLRRVPPRHFHLDENIGRVRPSSAAFEDDGPNDPMSVYVRSIVESEGRTPASLMTGHSDFALVEIRADFVRSQEQTVHPDGEDDSAHAVICGPKPKSRRVLFAKQAAWVIRPPD